MLLTYFESRSARCRWSSLIVHTSVGKIPRVDFCHHHHLQHWQGAATRIPAMSSTANPLDKEPGALINAPTKLPASSESEDEPRPSFRQNLFVLVLLWTAWLIGITFDTLLEIDNRAWNRGRMSPLQRYVYMHNWDLWVYKVRTPSFIFTVSRKLTDAARSLQHSFSY
jgi:hypothetical protein